MFFDTVKSGDYETLAEYLALGGNKKKIVLGGVDAAQLRLELIGDADSPLLYNVELRQTDGSLAIGLVSAIMMAGISRDSQKLYNQGTTLTIAYSISSLGVSGGSTDKFGLAMFTRVIDSPGRLESGIIYPIFQIAGLIEANTGHLAPLDLWPLIALSAGIAPTLIMVRAKLGTSNESSQTRGNVSDLQFGSGVVVSTQVQSHNIALTEIALGDRGAEDKVLV
ncbi:hypothetical protein VNI00_012489 [Paramarasmius palmivorus]|uniref:Uncharacterized protein n=1 Tax=Paramarasmius palmivorus TaxID=297713 RepID=A0AAW0C4R6_9AGAR